MNGAIVPPHPPAALRFTGLIGDARGSQPSHAGNMGVKSNNKATVMSAGVWGSGLVVAGSGCVASGIEDAVAFIGVVPASIGVAAIGIGVAPAGSGSARAGIGLVASGKGPVAIGRGAAPSGKRVYDAPGLWEEPRAPLGGTVELLPVTASTSGRDCGPFAGNREHSWEGLWYFYR